MTVRKSERLMNLVICLLVARTYVPKAKIREAVEGYRDQSDDAFEKMFERDKDELRDLGVPVEVGFVDKVFEDEPGYRIRRTAFELPEIRLDPEEAAVVGLAARVWQHARLAEATSGALVKLRAAGVDVDRSALAVVEPHLAASEPAFEPLWDAVVTRTPVRFQYQRPGQSAPAPRTVQPWGILSWHGHWYVVGHDTDRDAPRMFRLSRVIGHVPRPASRARAPCRTAPTSENWQPAWHRRIPPAPRCCAFAAGRVSACGGKPPRWRQQRMAGTWWRCRSPIRMGWPTT